MDLSYNGILADTKAKMKKCVSYLEEELKGLRTGRASAGLVEAIRVEYYGSMTPLKDMAAISTSDARTIVIKPFDGTQVKAIEKSILAANIGMTPSSDGKVVRLNVPPLTQETRQKLAAKVKELAEAQRVAVRNIRRDANKHAEQSKKDTVVTEDQAKKLEDEIQSATKASEKDIDGILQSKTKELMEL
jgi:ribosome recycling factor